MKMQALRNGVKSLRSDVSTPCWVETGEAGRIGAAEGISGRVIFADFSSRTPGKIYRKNSDSPHRLHEPIQDVERTSLVRIFGQEVIMFQPLVGLKRAKQDESGQPKALAVA